MGLGVREMKARSPFITLTSRFAPLSTPLLLKWQVMLAGWAETICEATLPALMMALPPQAAWPGQTTPSLTTVSSSESRKERCALCLSCKECPTQTAQLCHRQAAFILYVVHCY